MPAEDLKLFGITEDQLFLPGQAQVIHFAMAPAARIKGRLLGTGAFSMLALSSLTPEERKKEKARAPDRPTGHVKIRQSPLPHWRIWLVGKDLPPASSVLASAETDADGNFVFESVPLGFEWHFQTERHTQESEPKSPGFKLNRTGDVSFDLELLEGPEHVAVPFGKA